MTKPIAWYARRYIERFGMHLVPIEPGRKFPRASDWGNQTISDPDQAHEYYSERSNWNMGLALGPSRFCSLDIDCDASFSAILDELGIDPQELAKFPTIQGASKGRRVMFRVPDGVELGYHKLTWPSRNDPTGEKHKAAMRLAAEAKQAGDVDREARIRKVAARWARYTVIELRSSCDGKQRQDVLPPSVHPDTGNPYRWLTQPSDDWPGPPDWLVSIWQAWDKFKPQLSAMCPWLPEQKQVAAPPARVKDSRVSGSVIQQFLDAHDLETMLGQYGYQRKGRRRYLSPHSSTGLPGVTLMPGGQSCWIHHASDPLCSDETGRPVNAFDLYAYNDHGGDIKRAVSAAAKLLGIEPQRRPRVVDNAPSVAASTDSMPDPVVATDYYAPLRWAKPNGKPYKNIENLADICDRLGVTIRYNVIKKQEEIIIPGERFMLDNEANASLAWLTSACSMFEFPTDKLSDFITYLADKNPYNPVAQWIDSKPWDGNQRLDQLYATITAKGEQHDEQQLMLKCALMRRWLISAVAAAYQPDGIAAAGLLVLQGDQYLGKTAWFKSLVPADLDALQDGMLLKPDDKDSVKQICSYWLVELGELDSTFRKADIAQLKAFITKQADILRPAYARREARYPRRTVFFGSVNPREYLNDPTGNRRFWTIECEAINHKHGLDMQQVWAEVKQVWQQGEGYYLTPDEMAALNQHNEQFASSDPVEERILGRLDWASSPAGWRWMQVTDVLLECGIDRPTRNDLRTASQIIRTRNGGQSKRSSGKNLLLVPLRYHSE